MTRISQTVHFNYRRAAWRSKLQLITITSENRCAANRYFAFLLVFIRLVQMVINKFHKWQVPNLESKASEQWRMVALVERVSVIIKGTETQLRISSTFVTYILYFMTSNTLHTHTHTHTHTQSIYVSYDSCHKKKISPQTILTVVSVHCVSTKFKVRYEINLYALFTCVSGFKWLRRGTKS